MTRDESRDVYQRFVERNARLPTIITSNRDTAEYLAMFDDTLLAQSAVDRFKNDTFDLVIDGEPYRPRLKPRSRTRLRLRLRWSSRSTRADGGARASPGDHVGRLQRPPEGLDAKPCRAITSIGRRSPPPGPMTPASGPHEGGAWQDPCNTCNTAMERWTQAPPDGKGASVTDNWPTNNSRTYRGGTSSGSPRTRHQ
jgi:hypothetical protein